MTTTDDLQDERNLDGETLSLAHNGDVNDDTYYETYNYYGYNSHE